MYVLVGSEENTELAFIYLKPEPGRPSATSIWDSTTCNLGSFLKWWVDLFRQQFFLPKVGLAFFFSSPAARITICIFEGHIYMMYALPLGCTCVVLTWKFPIKNIAKVWMTQASGYSTIICPLKKVNFSSQPTCLIGCRSEHLFGGMQAA